MAQIIGKRNAGGVETVIHNYYRFLDHSRYQFDFFIDSDGDCKLPREFTDMGARYFVIPPYQSTLSHIVSLIRCFKKNTYSIVHSNMNTLSVLSLFAAWIAGVPVRICHNHSTAGKGETKKNIMKYLLRPFAKLFATHCWACSRASGQWLFGKKAMERGIVTVIHNAINIHKYAYDSEKRKTIRRRCDLEDKYVVGHVGRFCFQKNHEFLIDVFQRVHDRDPSAVLMLIGIGELQEPIIRKVHRLGLEKSVMFLGERDDVDQLYQAMDVFVLPSRYEGLPLVGVEAQTSGLPCIFSDQITPETVITPETIRLGLDQGAEVWAKAIIDCKHMKRHNALSDVKNAGFDIQTEAKKLEMLYDRLLNKPSDNNFNIEKPNTFY